MKRIAWLLICLLMSVLASAQTQQGIVKTRGRMMNGVLQPGQGLQGAIVQIKNRQAVVSGKYGKFSFPLQTNSYLVQSVKKQGYQLVDMEACRTYNYSADLLYLVMDTPEQQQADRLAAERKIRRNLQRQLQQREDEIEALQASQAVKDSLLYILYQQQGDNEKIIADMAKRYAALDYDQLDEFYRQVNDMIENGELTRADSLLRTRGNVEAQVEAQLQRGQAIHEQKEQLQKAEAVHAADNEELARRCYAYYEKFQQQYNTDSAAHYLELRAALDTTNYEWMNDAGQYVEKYVGNYETAHVYYNSILNQSLLQSENQVEWIVKAYNYVGNNYLYLNSIQNAYDCFTKALAFLDRLSGKSRIHAATTYANLGRYYYGKSDRSKAMAYFEKALEITKSIYGESHEEVGRLYYLIGLVYKDYTMREAKKEYYENARKNYTQALHIFENEYGHDHWEVARIYVYLSELYYDLHKNESDKNIVIIKDKENHYEIASEYLTKAIKIMDKQFNDDNLEAATMLSSLSLNKYLHDNDRRLFYLNKATPIFEKILNNNHPLLGSHYHNIASTYRSKCDYAKALEYYEKARPYYESRGANQYMRSQLYSSMGGIYEIWREYEKAFEMYARNVEIYRKIRDERFYSLSLNRVGIILYKAGNYAKAIECFNQVLPFYEKLYSSDSVNVCNWGRLCFYIGYAYDCQGDTTMASTYYGKAKNIRSIIRDTFEYNSMMAESYNEIGMIRHRQGKDSIAMDYFNKALAILEKRTYHFLELAHTHSNIAMVYYSKQDYTKVLEHWNKALTIQDELLCKNHPNMVHSYKNIGNVYYIQGNYAEALDYYRKSLVIIENYYGTEDLNVAQPYQFIGKVYFNLKDYPKALEYTTKALTIWKKRQDDNIANVAECYCNNGIYQAYLKKHSKALEFLDSALTIQETVFGADHPSTMLTKNNIDIVRKMSISHDEEAMKEYVFTVTLDDGDTPANRQGMTGEYVVLELGDWSIERSGSIFDIIDDIHAPITIVTLKDTEITIHNFKDKTERIGLQLDLKKVGSKEKEQIIQAYKEWKIFRNQILPKQ